MLIKLSTWPNIQNRMQDEITKIDNSFIQREEEFNGLGGGKKL
jgi:hypothetical protein